MPKYNYRKHDLKRDNILKDTRNHFERFRDKIARTQAASTMFILSAVIIMAHPWFSLFADILFVYNSVYFIWFVFFSKKYELPFKMPKTSEKMDPNNKGPGGGSAKKAEGILFIGNEERTSEEIWFTNSDARTHILYLGTTGAGKTEGLKSLVTNALGWGSGFVYVDGKADTDLWGSLSALARRFGRDDDLLVLNYMTGNSDTRTASNTINPFSHGSASYLSNLLVSLMPEGGGDNAMWKDRAVSLINALMPVLTWQRTNQEKS
jgi:intracellular multiplication protein IcmO